MWWIGRDFMLYQLSVLYGNWNVRRYAIKCYYAIARTKLLQLNIFYSSLTIKPITIYIVIVFLSPKIRVFTYVFIVVALLLFLLISATLKIYIKSSWFVLNVAVLEIHLQNCLHSSKSWVSQQPSSCLRGMRNIKDSIFTIVDLVVWFKIRMLLKWGRGGFWPFIKNL